MSKTPRATPPPAPDGDDDADIKRRRSAGSETEETLESTTELVPIVETASTAVAAQAEASIKARYALAMMRPRSWDRVRIDLLAECARPKFAHRARYLKPVGAGITGPSIRFAEAALRCMRNVLVEQMVTYDDPDKRIIRITTTDLEAGLTYFRDVVVEKTVERSDPSDRAVLSSRKNKYGRTVYLVEATDDDLLTKESALASKAMRTCGLRLVPADLIDEAMDVVRDALSGEHKRDKTEARKKMVDAFATVGVSPEQIVSYLGHPLDLLTDDEYAELRGVFSAIKDGEARWADVAARDRKAAGREGVSAPVKPAEPETDEEVTGAGGNAWDDPVAIKHALAHAGRKRRGGKRK